MADHLGEGENFTSISNEILEALASAKLNGTQYAIVMVVVRYTYGFRRCEWQLSHSFISTSTGLNQRQVRRELQVLVQRGIILSDQPEGKTATLKINKNISDWLDLDQTPRSNPTPQTKKTPDDSDPPPGSNPTEDTGLIRPPRNKKPKESNKNIFTPESIEMEMSALLYQKTLDHYPGLKEPNMQAWAKHIDLLIRVDNKDPVEVKKVILWAKADSFWKPNIMSTEKLRKQYDQLNAKRIEEQNKASPSKTKAALDKLM